MLVTKLFIAGLLLMLRAEAIKDVELQKQKGNDGLANFCARCESGIAGYTPEENDNRDICLKRVKQRIFTQWRANNFSFIRKNRLRPIDLLRILEKEATSTCNEEWAKQQCKKYCLGSKLPTKVECKNLFTYKETPRTLFLCPRRMDLRNIICVQSDDNNFDFVVSKCNYCQKLYDADANGSMHLMKEVKQFPLPMCCKSNQVCENWYIFKKWSLFAPICCNRS